MNTRHSMTHVSMLLFCAAMTLGACGKSRGSSPRNNAPADTAAQPAGAAPAASRPADDPLWALAPERAVFGVIVARGAGQKLEQIVIELRAILNARPSGKAMLADIERIIKDETRDAPIDVLDMGAWKKNGVDPARGAALFMDEQKDLLLAVFPVGDREAFRKLVKAPTETVNGKTVDRLDEAYCYPIREHYACSEDMAVLEAVEKAAPGSTPGPLARRAARRPAEMRGDIEIVADAAAMDDLMDDFQDLGPAMKPDGTLAISLALQGGEARMHVWIGGERSGPVGQSFADLTATPTLLGLMGKATQIARVHLPMEFLLGAGDVPATLPAPGDVDLRKALLDNLTGEVVGHAVSGDAFAYRITAPVKDRESAQKAAVAVCQLLAGEQTDLPIQVNDAGCSTLLDLGALASGEPDLAPFARHLPKVPVSLHATARGFELTAGAWTRQPASGPGSGQDGVGLQGGAMTRDLATGTWHGSFWAMSFDPLGGLSGPLARTLDDMLRTQVPAEEQAMIDVFRWLVGHVYDMSLGVALRQDGLHVVMGMTTLGADPADARAAHQRALGLILDGKRDAYSQALAEITRSHPGTLAGRHASEALKGISLATHMSPMMMVGGMVFAGMRSAAEPLPEAVAE